jgi:hypothetical protein
MCLACLSKIIELIIYHRCSIERYAYFYLKSTCYIVSMWRQYNMLILNKNN